MFFRNVQVELAKYSRLISGFPDLFLSEADQSMIVLKNLDVEVKRYILLRAKIDSMVVLERAIKFYDANIKILNFAEKGKDHANPLLFEEKRKGKGKKKGKGKGKEGDKGKKKGKGKEKENEKGKGKEKGRATTERARVMRRAAARTSLRSPRTPTSTPTSSATIAMRWDIFRISVRSLRWRKLMQRCLSPSLREPRLQSPSCLHLRLTFLRDVPCIACVRTTLARSV